ncbi:discoidin domain-containing protein [Lentzea tibetensis]|nr:discoidin domain-containing protein [Lentzea tibetensis]
MKTRRLLGTALAVLLAATFTPPVEAEQATQHGSWFNTAGIGWFPHWGLGTGRPEDRVENSAYVYRNAEEFERATEQAGWSADRMVDVAKRMRAGYISISSLHSRLGYLKIWPSGVPGSVATKRDFLGELVTAADKAGIKVVVYITGDPLWWNDNRDDQSAPPPKWLPYGDTGWLDVRGYQAFKNDPSIDIRKRVDWKRHYARDVVDEIITRYPKVGGFWFDGWGGDANNAEGKAAIELFQHIHERLPGAVNIKNNGGGVTVPGEDVAAMEDCQSCLHRKEPDYDLPSQFPRGPYQYENAFETLGWWQRHADTGPWTPQQNAFHLKKPITSIANTWVPNWGIGNDMSGGLPPAGEALVAQMDRFMSWADESMIGVRGGGYAEGGFDPGYWNDGSYGVTTMKPDGRTHYLHVLTPPSGKQLVVPDAGYDVTGVRDLKTGKRLHFTRYGGKLRITVPSWDAAVNEASTVLKVTTLKRTRVLPTKGWTATATAVDGTNVPANAVDGDYATRYRGLGERNDLTVDMQRKRVISGLRVVQPESSRIAVLNEGEKIQSTRIKDYVLSVSADGQRWRDVASGQLANQRGSQTITFGPAFARYARLTVGSVHNGATNRMEVVDVRAISPW